MGGRLGAGGATLMMGVLAAIGLAGRAPAPSAPAPDPGSRDSVVAVGPGRLGASGALRVLLGTPDRWRVDSLVGRLLSWPGFRPGIAPLRLVAPDGDPVTLVTLLPFAAKTGPRLEGYRLGTWPGERRPGEPLPLGFIRVTEGNQDLKVSRRFRLRDFLTHDQASSWPKFLVLEPRLLDKLELIGDELARRGQSSVLRVMSGFRTPQYNALGVGPKGGRARDSRHTYGDAADVFVDGNGDGVMDDLDGDGRITVADGRYLLALAERVERRHPELVGGLSAYPATTAHGPFLHVDARGHRARW